MGLFPKEQNFIKSLISHGCARPWYVYIETFAPAAMEAFITVALLDLEDAIRGRGEKIVRRGATAGGRGFRHATKLKTLGQELKYAKYSFLGLKTILILTTPLELIGFTWLVYSAIDEAFFNWQSALERSDFCTQPINSGPLHRSRGPGTIAILPGGSPIPLPTLVQDRAGWGSSTINVGLPEGQFQCLFAMNIGSPPGGITGVKIRLRVTDFLTTYFIDSEEQDIAAKEVKDFVMSVAFFLPTNFGGSVVWELVGPAVPVGIFTGGGNIMIQRVG